MFGEIRRRVGMGDRGFWHCSERGGTMSHEFRLGGPFLFQPVDEGNRVKLYIGAMCDP